MIRVFQSLNTLLELGDTSVPEFEYSFRTWGIRVFQSLNALLELGDTSVPEFEYSFIAW